MIVTVTPNPSIDRTIHLDRLVPGAVNRATSATAEAAGKGVNVSCALAVEGAASIAVLPLATRSAAQYLALLGASVRISPVRVSGSVRVNLTIVETDGTVTKVNEPGEMFSGADADALVRAADVIRPAEWVVGCGSLPPGAPCDFYARLARLGTVQRRVAIDSSGDALTAALSERVALVKPNRDELDTLVGRTSTTLGDVVDSTRALLERGCDGVLVSLGADGAIFADRAGVTHAEAKVAGPVNTVGAGDALLAGFLAAGGSAESLRTGVAWAVAAVRSPGSRMRPVTDADRAAVVVHPRIDPARRLAA
jgi:1-phosphofructokinase family hexose kinase